MGTRSSLSSFIRNDNPNHFSDSELLESQKQCQDVAEAFLPFDMNVTTRDRGIAALAKSNVTDFTWGIRAANTQPTAGFNAGIGGIAYLNSFSSDQDTPIFTFNEHARDGGVTNSHEVGHALGLQHHGLIGQSYHAGAGTRQAGHSAFCPILAP